MKYILRNGTQLNRGTDKERIFFIIIRFLGRKSVINIKIIILAKSLN